MKERSIIFNAPEVHALLSGAKTQTRRVMKPQPFAEWSGDQARAEMVRRGALGEDESLTALVNQAWNAGFIDATCPYGKPGDRLWVRETWAPDEYAGQQEFYRADNEHFVPPGGWKPSTHMPRAVSRITLEITAVRVERLQDISEADAIAEGCNKPACGPDYTLYKRWAYRNLRNEINGPGSWDANPWVWVVQFKRA